MILGEFPSFKTAAVADDSTKLKDIETDRPDAG